VSRRWIWLVATLAACDAAPNRRLPGAALTAAPHVVKVHASVACGDDVALDGDAVPDVRYRYTYDAIGRVAHETGKYSDGEPDDAVDFSYDFLDHMTHMVETNGLGETGVEIVAIYDTLGDLIDYTNDQTSISASDTLDYQFSELTDTGQPTREVIAELGQPDIHYALAYDDSGRLAFVVQDGGVATTYTYDDDGRTTTIDTDNGAVVGVLVFDDQNRELSETWGGSDPFAIASDETYDYDGDRLLDITYRSGTTADPQLPTFVETDTIEYDCAM
jgi:YD repeat-containing protein